MNDYSQNYSSVESILDFAKPLAGKTLRDFLSIDEQKYIIENSRNKGDLGNLVEKYYFKINPGNVSAPDFLQAGIELKTTAVLPYGVVKYRKNTALGLSRYRAKERLKLSIINYNKVVKEDWSSNSLFKKCETILLLMTLYEAGVLMIDRKFMAEPLLWSLPDKDLEFIRNDWMTIVSKVRAGKAHELSGSDTYYLEACTSGSGTLKEQPFSPVRAKERSFAFKSSYVTNSFLNGATFVDDFESVLKESDSAKDFEKIILKRTEEYVGVEVGAIAKMLNTELSKAKHYLALLSYKMLSIRTNRAEEFVKGGIEIKTINLKPNGTPSQDMSFPAFSYMDIVNEDWEESVFKQKIDTKILLMIFQTNIDGSVSFLKSVFWSMPRKDIKEAKRVWEETKSRVANGHADKLPLKAFSDVSHVRNKGRNSKPENYIPSPKNGMLRAKCFWLNAGYVKEQVAKVL